MSSDELLEQYHKNQYYYLKGGITVTGGEAIMNIDFLIDFFTKAKKKNIHTCLDTSGATFNQNDIIYMDKIDRLLAVTDLILLDLKHIDSKKHLELTGVPNENILLFAKYLSLKKIDVWIRHVVIPTITDDPIYWHKLGYFLASLRNIKAIDILPYHLMGTSKYEAMNMKYPLEGIPAAPKELAIEAREIILAVIKRRRQYLKKIIQRRKAELLDKSKNSHL